MAWLVLLWQKRILIIFNSSTTMQIDSRNFEQHLDLILQEIQTAHFIAFDCEFTGLVTQTNSIEGLYPDHREFYQRIKETALNFSLLQLGITLFHYDNGQYFPKAYNFYVSAAQKSNFNKIFVSEWDSMAFLAKNNMNFSQAFQYGIDFKRIDQSPQQPIKFNPLQDKEYNAKIFYSPADLETISSIEKLIKSQQMVRIDFKSKRIFDYFRSTYDMSFDKPKKNMQKYEYSCRIYPKHQDFFEQESKEQLEKYAECCKKVEDISLNDKEHLEIHKNRTLEVIFAKIIQCSKPIVGHFPNLDIGLIYQAFIGDLPDTYEEFANTLNKLFPYIFDTKIISRRLQNKMKSIKVDLKSLYKSCFSKKGLQPYCNINFKHVEKYLQEESSHEAGYDSFMTGCAFIAMLNFLYDSKKEAFVFSKAVAENNLLYSRFTGEISLLGPVFTPKTTEYNKRIIIYGQLKNDHPWEQLGSKMSKYGTLSVCEDHGQTYYVYDEDQNIQHILKEAQGFKDYEHRNIIKARAMFR